MSARHNGHDSRRSRCSRADALVVRFSRRSSSACAPRSRHGCSAAKARTHPALPADIIRLLRKDVGLGDERLPGCSAAIPPI